MRTVFATAILLLICAPALADERDDVMAGAARCAGIADKRIWLDCFYGAAQPMRGALGLVPAPPAQVRLVPPPGAAYVSPPGAARASVARQQPQDPKGFFGALLGSTGPLVSNMAMAQYRFYRDTGGFRVTLQDGSVWQQDEADAAANPAHWNGPAPSLTVTITNGGTGSYKMRVGGERGPLYKVHRV